MIPRHLEKKLRSTAEGFPAVMLTGPRQSGKTTLVRSAFPEKPYVSLENPDNRRHAEKDPRGFLAQYPAGAILDEAQRIPEIFSYLQGIIDEKQQPGLFILTGSQNFLLSEKVSQSLAGRVAILQLLPFGWDEIVGTSYAPGNLEEILTKGFYPGLYKKGVDAAEWHAGYIQTYLERDVRLIKSIMNIGAFQTFLKMCAGRTGQLLNLSALANDCGISHTTAREWIGILEVSFIVYQLRPHHKNFNKRLVKMPKLYFYDTGLACALLGIESSKDFETHHLRGALFETFVLSELMKQRFNAGKRPNIYFWRDKTGHEIDALIENGEKLTPIEIKAGKTVNDDFFDNIRYWNRLAGEKAEKSYLIYGGEKDQKWKEAEVLGWKSIGRIKS